MTSPSDELIERVARAICECQGLNWAAQANFMTSGGGGENEQLGYLEMAQAALRAISPGLLDGSEVVMPRELTDEMGLSVLDCWVTWQRAGKAGDWDKACYRAIRDAYLTSKEGKG